MEIHISRVEGSFVSAVCSGWVVCILESELSYRKNKAENNGSTPLYNSKDRSLYEGVLDGRRVFSSQRMQFSPVPLAVEKVFGLAEVGVWSGWRK